MSGACDGTARGTQFLDRAGPAGQATALGQGCQPPSRQRVSGERVLAGVERAFRASGEGFSEPASRLGPIPGAGRNLVSCRRACDRQRLHVFFRQPALSDPARTSASRHAAPAPACGTPAERGVEGSLSGRYLDIAECSAATATPEPVVRKPPRKDHNAGGKSAWMQGFFDRPTPPLCQLI